MNDWHSRYLTENEKAEIRQKLEEKMEEIDYFLTGDKVEITLTLTTNE